MKQETQYERMTKTPVARLVMRLAIPSVVSMMVSTLYNMVDTWFVARLGTLAVGACGVAFSIMEFISSMGYLFGMGGGTVIGMLLGARRPKEAGVVGSTAFFSALAIGALAAGLGLAFIEPLMLLLGSSRTLLPYAVAYSRFILAGVPVMCASLVLSTILRCEGKNQLSMIGIGCGAVLNMLLDPVFIFALGLGIAGAALATLVSQTVGLAVLLVFFLTGRSETKLSVRSVSLSPAVHREILVTGLPSLCRHGVTTLANIALNVAAGRYGGDMLIAALSIVTKVTALIQSVLKGIFQGAQSIFSYNKGAGRYDRVRAAYFFTLTFNTILITAAAFAMLRLAAPIIRLYSVTDPDVFALGVRALIVQTFALILMPWNFSGNTMLQSVGEPMKSTLLAALPQGLCYIPALFLLPRFLGADGVILAPLAGQAVSAVVTLPFIRWYFAKMRREEQARVTRA